MALSVEVVCPECKQVRRIGRQQARNRKSDVCAACYRKNPYKGGAVKKDRKAEKATVNERTLDALALAAMGLPTAEAVAQAGITFTQFEEAKQQVERLKPMAEAVKTHQADKLYILAQVLLDSIDSGDLAEMDAKEKIQAAAKAIDTARILEGKPTEIVAQFKAVMEKYHVKVETTNGAAASGEHQRQGGEEAGVVDGEAVVVEEGDGAGGGTGAAAPDVLQQYSGSGEAGPDSVGGSGESSDAGADGAGAVSVSRQVWPFSRECVVPGGSADRQVAGER